MADTEKKAAPAATPVKEHKETSFKSKNAAPAKKGKKEEKLQKIDVEVSEKKGVKTHVKGHQAPAVVERLQEKYEKEIVPALVKEFGYKNVMEVPHLVKIVLNMRVGKATVDSKAIEEAVNDLTLISGQKPLVTTAKKSIANFHLREGQAIGCKVTLRRVRMYDFLDKLVNICLPRVRDFRGVSADSFDGRGSYSLGIKEQLIFPEIDYDKVSRVQGMDITIVTSAKTDKEARALLKGLGMPFSK